MKYLNNEYINCLNILQIESAAACNDGLLFALKIGRQNIIPSARKNTYVTITIKYFFWLGVDGSVEVTGQKSPPGAPDPDEDQPGIGNDDMIHQISFWGRIRIRFFQGSDMDPVGTLGVIRIRVDPQPLFIL